MYTQEQAVAIPLGLTALEEAGKGFKRIIHALNALRKVLRPIATADSFFICLPGFAAHPYTTAYKLHHGLVFTGGQQDVRVLYCTCGDDSLEAEHGWSSCDEPFDTEWVHLFAGLPYVMGELENYCGPKFRERIEQLGNAAALIGPFLT